MKTRALILSLFAIFAFSMFSLGQAAEKSSGVVKLNLKKSGGEVKQDVPIKKNEVNPGVQGGSGAVKLNMTKSVPQSVPQVTNANLSIDGDLEGINWISPTFNQVNTSEGVYKIQANVQSKEQIRVVNFFVDGKYYKNFIPSGQVKNQVYIEQALNLRMGANSVRLEAITVSNNKLEGSVNIIYDLSKAKFHALIIAVQDYDDPNISDLDEPIKDADKFYNVIVSKYTFSEDNILYLKNPTKADIIGTLHQMRGILKPEDNLLIYYAGHGYWDEEMMTGYWLPSDASRDNPAQQ